MSDIYFDMQSVKQQLFDTGVSFFYSCIFTKYEWFEKEFSIEKLIEPKLVTVVEHSIHQDVLENTHTFLSTTTGFTDIIRKYAVCMVLDNGENLNLSLYENIKGNIIVVYLSNVTLGFSLSETQELFYKKIIQIKIDLGFDHETVIIKNKNFNTFKKLYNVAFDLYPEDVIKKHDKQ
jgi:hypothetical protein